MSNNITKMVNLPTWISNCDSRNPVPLDLLLPSDDIFCSRVDFSTLGNFDHVFVLAVSFRKK